MNIKKLTKFTALAAVAAAGVMMTSCRDSVSYSDMLRDEEHATNWFMANQNIITSAPADSIFICGEDAPFYRMDKDGFIYMQVINPGNGVKAKKGDEVYFRFRRKNLKMMYAGDDPAWEGNIDDMASTLGSMSFIFDDMTVTASQTYGSGIQLPLRWLSYYSEVNLVLRSYYGFSTDQSTCQSYIYNIKYYKAEY